MVLRCKPIFSVLVFHQFMVYWIYFQKGFILFSMPNCGYIMLFRSVISVYLLNLLVKFKRLFCCMIWLYTVGLLSTYERALCVKLSPQKVGVGIEQVLRQMYQIELAYVLTVSCVCRFNVSKSYIFVNQLHQQLYLLFNHIVNVCPLILTYCIPFTLLWSLIIVPLYHVG